MTASTKETIYIDTEDEITAIIDKIIVSNKKVIALVLPKHASVFQSQINLKLLQKTSRQAKKGLVLITSDRIVTNMAGAASIHVASTLNSKPVIPARTTVAADRTVGSNSPNGTQAVAATEVPISMADVSDKSGLNIDGAVTSEEPEEIVMPKKTKLKIPDFKSFQIKLLLASLVVVLLAGGWVVGFMVLPKATIAVSADISSNPVETKITVNVNDSTTLDVKKRIVPAKRVQIEKLDSVTVAATGDKNIGEKATGQITLENCINDGEDKVIPAGTSFSVNDKTFVTTEQVILPFAIFAGNSCLSKTFNREKTVAIEASAAGPEFNLEAQAYKSSISGIKATGTKTTGGTTQMIKVISQQDLDKGKQELSGKSKSDAFNELKKQLQDKGLRAINETLKEGTPNTVISPGVGEQAREAKVTMTVTYSLIGLADSDISAIIEDQAKVNLGDKQQNIRDLGMSGVNFTLLESPDDSTRVMLLRTITTVGPDIDLEKTKEIVAGKKRGEIESMLEAIDGVRSVSVEYSPAWITTTPKSAEKITIELKESNE